MTLLLGFAALCAVGFSAGFLVGYLAGRLARGRGE
jgi:NhaP-type Na+/H+ or K+/H+ antiporter